MRGRGTGWSWGRLLTLHLALWRSAMPCCSKELSPLLCLFPSSSPSAHVRLSKDAERQTWRGRRPAEQSQSHHLDLSKHSAEGGRQKRDGKGREIKWGGGGLTACMTQGESLTWIHYVYDCRVGDIKRHGIGKRVCRRPCEKAREKNLCVSTCAKQWKERNRQMGKNDQYLCRGKKNKKYMAKNVHLC